MLVWGTSARHYPQHCGLAQMLEDEDVVQIVKKKVNDICLCFSHLLSINGVISSGISSYFFRPSYSQVYKLLSSLIK